MDELKPEEQLACRADTTADSGHNVHQVSPLATGKECDDTVLSLISELAINVDGPSGRFAYNDSTKLRNLVANKPAIWTSLVSSFVVDGPSIANTRWSHGEKLDVVLDTCDGLTSCLAVLSSALPHVSRWRSFTVRSTYGAEVSRPDDDAQAVLDAIEVCCRDAVFLDLEHLSLEFSPDSICGFDCASWNIHNLRHLSTPQFYALRNLLFPQDTSNAF